MTLAEFEKLLDVAIFQLWEGDAKQRVLDAFAAKCAEADALRQASANAEQRIQEAMDYGKRACEQRESARAKADALREALKNLRSFAASVWFDDAAPTDEEREAMERARAALSAPRNEEPKPMIRTGFGELIDQYLAKKITWDELFRKTAALGYKPTGLYEIARLIRAAEPRSKEPSR